METIKYTYALFNSSDVYSLFIVDTKGNNYGWGIKSNGSTSLVLISDILNNQSIWFLSLNASDPDLVYLPSHEEKPGVNIRNLPWYNATIKADAPIFSPVSYILLEQYTPIVTLTAPIYNSSRELIGIVGSNIGIIPWKTFLHNQVLPYHSAKIFIVDREGILYVDSNPGIDPSINLNGTFNATNNVTSAPENINALNSTDPFIAAASRVLGIGRGTIPDFDSDRTMRKRIHGVTYFIFMSELNILNMNLIVVMGVPEKEFTGKIDQSRKLTIAITCAATILGALRYIPWHVMRKVTKINPARRWSLGSTGSSRGSSKRTSICAEGVSLALTGTLPNSAPSSPLGQKSFHVKLEA